MQWSAEGREGGVFFFFSGVGGEVVRKKLDKTVNRGAVLYERK